MTDYNYSDQTDLNPAGLVIALADNGVTDGLITLNGTDLTVEAGAGQQAAIDQAVLDATGTALAANKAVRIDAAIAKSEVLRAEGKRFDRPSDDGIQKGPIVVSVENRTEMRNMKLDAADGLLSFPQVCETTTEKGCTMFTSADLDAAYTAVVARYQEIKEGEEALIASIKAAANQAALDAVVDART